MSISFVKHRDALMKAFKDVCDDKTATDWVVFGYDGKTYDLKVVDTGEDGIEEMADSLNSSKIQYVFLRVIDPNSKLHKNVLINWIGEGAPVSKKGACARHVQDVANLFRGAHVTINARMEDDVDEDTILKLVAKSSGSNYGFHKEKPSGDVGQTGPVGSVYKRTNAALEIKSKRSDKFWQEMEDDEKSRVKQDQTKKQQENAERQKETVEREKKEAFEREQKLSQKMKAVDTRKQEEQRLHEQTAKAEQARWEARQEVDAAPTRRTGDAEERRKEMANMISQRKMSTDQSDEPPAPPPARTAAPPPARTAVRPPMPAPQPEPEPAYEPEPEPESAFEPEPEPEPAYQPEPEPEEAYETEQYLQEEPPQDPYREAEQQQPAPADDPYPEEPEQELYENQETLQVSSDSQGVSARALYDYQAEDDTEITFDPGDIITQIEQIDEGWWRGQNPSGNYGLFPANYVELI